MDVATILKAIEMVGAGTQSAMKIYDGFMAVGDSVEKAGLKAGYAAAKARSDALHADVQDRLSAP